MKIPKPTLVLAMDKQYYDKAAVQLFPSLDANWDGRTCILCLGFIPDPTAAWRYTDPQVEYASCQLEKLSSYRTDWPTNRKFYVCAEGGDFLEYFDFYANEIIIHIDADMVMQRPFTDQELKEIYVWTKGDQVASTYNSYPYGTMSEERVKIGGNLIAGEDQPVFNCGMICCNASTYYKLRIEFNRRFNEITKECSHHATGQYLINAITHQKLQFVPLFGAYSCGLWFHNHGEITERENLLYFRGELVLFNHNKFRKPNGFTTPKPQNND